MHDILVKTLPPGCRLTAILDVSAYIIFPLSRLTTPITVLPLGICPRSSLCCMAHPLPQFAPHIHDTSSQYSTEGKLKEPNLAAEAGQGLLSAVTSYARGDMGGVLKSALGLVKTAGGSTQKAEKYARATKTSPADVVSFILQVGAWSEEC